MEQDVLRPGLEPVDGETQPVGLPLRPVATSDPDDRHPARREIAEGLLIVATVDVALAAENAIGQTSQATNRLYNWS